MTSLWFTLHINPEPWAVGSISTGARGARMSPNPNLVAFQNAVRESMAGTEMLDSKYRRFEFYFFRQTAVYLDSRDRKRSRNQADATNMQKGLEDALQGILFENDRDVVDIRSVIAMQGPEVEPMILIRAMPVGDVMSDILDTVPVDVLKAGFAGAAAPKRAKNEWDDGGFF